jgi:hypothetical protein
MEFLYVENNEYAEVVEYNSKAGERLCKHLEYHPELKYPLATEIINDADEFNEPIIYHNKITHEDYLYLCNYYKITPEKGCNDLRIWAGIHLLNDERKEAVRVINNYLDCIKLQLQTPYIKLMQKKLPADQLKNLTLYIDMGRLLESKEI